MTEYVRKSSGIEKSLYRKVKYILADYDRMKRERLNILYGSSSSVSGTPGGTDIGKPTERKAEQLAVIDREIEAVDQSCMLLRGEYSGKVFDEFDPLKAYWSYDYFNYMHKRTEQSPEGPCRRTWYRFKDKLTLLVAKKLNYF